MTTRKVKRNVQQDIRLTLAELIEADSSGFQAFITKRAGYPEMTDVSYSIVGHSPAAVILRVQGDTEIYETVNTGPSQDEQGE